MATTAAASSGRMSELTPQPSSLKLTEIITRGQRAGTIAMGLCDQTVAKRGTIRSRQRFLGGQFEARVTIPAQLGVVSAFWSFFYEKTTTDERNHEIDIEFPGQASAHSPPALTHVTLSTWRGLAAGQSTAAFVKLPHAVADGAFHLLRFDWLPPSASQAPAVKFYIDDTLLHVARTNVPGEPANIWLGLWFPPQWAGKPEFTSVSMRVDWIRITPSRPR